MKTPAGGRQLTDMTQGPPRAILLRFGLPLIAANVLQQLYSFADGVILGRFGGAESLAILGTCTWALWFQTSVVMNFSQAACLLLARWFGAKDNERVRVTLGNMCLLSAGLCLAMTLGLQWLARPLLVWQNTPAGVLEASVLYLRLSFAGTVFLFVFNLCAAALRAVGDSKSPMVAISIASLLNIALDVLFVAGFGWGTAGAAAATLIAQLLAGVYCLWRVCRTPLFRLKRRHWRPQAGIMLEATRLSLPMVLQSLVIVLGGVYVQMHINGYGTWFAAGISAADKIFSMLETSAIALSQATASFVSQNYGARMFGRIRKGTASAVWLSLLFAAACFGGMLLFGRPLLAAFVAPQAMGYAWGYAMVAGAGLLVMYPMYVLRQAIQALGNTAVPLAAAVLQLLVRVLCAAFLPGLVGYAGLYWPTVLACFVTLVLIGCVFPWQLRAREGEHGGLYNNNS